MFASLQKRTFTKLFEWENSWEMVPSVSSSLCLNVFTVFTILCSRVWAAIFGKPLLVYLETQLRQVHLLNRSRARANTMLEYLNALRAGAPIDLWTLFICSDVLGELWPFRKFSQLQGLVAFSSHPKVLSYPGGSGQLRVRGNGVAVLLSENSRGALSLYRDFQETCF